MEPIRERIARMEERQKEQGSDLKEIKKLLEGNKKANDAKLENLEKGQQSLWNRVWLVKGALAAVSAYFGYHK